MQALRGLVAEAASGDEVDEVGEEEAELLLGVEVQQPPEPELLRRHRKAYERRAQDGMQNAAT